MDPSQPQFQPPPISPVQPAPPLNPPIGQPAPARKSYRRQAVFSIVALFVLAVAIFMTYDAQQTKIDRLDKQVSSLKSEVKALGGSSSSDSSDSSKNTLPGLIGGQQAKARDTARQTNMRSLQTEMEIFYANNGYYPSLGDINNSTWRAANMKNLDPNALVDPSNPTSSQTLMATPTANFFSYEVKNTDGASCEADDTTCAQYKLTAMLETAYNGSKTYSKSNLD
jgi:hypothetical protein